MSENRMHRIGLSPEESAIEEKWGRRYAQASYDDQVYIAALEADVRHLTEVCQRMSRRINEVSAQRSEKWKALSDLKKALRKIDTQAYRLAPSGEGEHASTWKDKPHRLIYDLCEAIEGLINVE